MGQAPILGIKLNSVTLEETDELIQFDQAYLRHYLVEIGIAADNLPFIFSREEIAEGLSQGDQIEWLIVDDKVKAGYFWFQKRKDCLFINGIALKPEFYGKGLAQYALRIAEQNALSAQLKYCRLAVTPINSRALKCYFKAGYCVMQYVSAYFGSEHPNTFRLIMVKSLDSELLLTSGYKNLEISCEDQTGQKEAIDKGYVGIGIIHSNSEYKIIFTLTKLEMRQE